ncbi:uncharacterized protein LOC100843086 [Brachypodium distachyon]|uniref:uncharacterized protein LOC100843086 n=1 Tax=Brachypodium distachyon TaxID=15368 RepID=UPI00052FEAEC|nr:uncharacterized protein LOC100843086 [Brachypodium distachyon]|eukprot:XP_010239145.1 uncharacterized protein LOC100843086 [Brachypodium distachyon]
MEMLDLRKVPSMKGQPPRFNRKTHDTPKIIDEAFASPDADYWKEAIRSEMDSIMANDDGPTSLAPQINGSPCEEDEDSQCAEAMGSWVQLPVDILHQIHAHMLLQDAARAACVSRGFLNSWRCYPKLVLNVSTLGINEDASKGVMTREFISRVDNIMHNRTCQGLKIFKLSTYPCSNLHPSYVDRWLQVAIRTGVKKLALQMTRGDKFEYNFPCSLLSSETGSSIQSIFLGGCSFHSVVQVGSMSSSLTRVDLNSVHITGEELSCFMSNSCSLEQLCLSGCDDMIFLKAPCLLLRLNLLDVMSCMMLEVIDINAPNLSTFNFNGRAIHISLGASLQVREIQIGSFSESGMLYHAITRVPSIAPNIQTLYLSTRDETVNTPMVLRRFLQLKYLEIELFTPNYSPDYDFYSLVSFLDASPALETFILRVSTHLSLYKL